MPPQCRHNFSGSHPRWKQCDCSGCMQYKYLAFRHDTKKIPSSLWGGMASVWKNTDIVVWCGQRHTDEPIKEMIDSQLWKGVVWGGFKRPREKLSEWDRLKTWTEYTNQTSKWRQLRDPQGCPQRGRYHFHHLSLSSLFCLSLHTSVWPLEQLCVLQPTFSLCLCFLHVRKKKIRSLRYKD